MPRRSFGGGMTSLAGKSDICMLKECNFLGFILVILVTAYSKHLIIVHCQIGIVYYPYCI